MSEIADEHGLEVGAELGVPSTAVAADATDEQVSSPRASVNIRSGC